MRGCRDLICSVLIYNVSHSFAAIALQLLLFSFINQTFGGEPSATTSLSSAGDGTSIDMRDRLPPKQYSYREEEEERQQASKLQPFIPSAKEERVKGQEAVQQGGRVILGSAPPKCTVGKCGRCSPCKAVRVPIQPRKAKVSLMEYYPEAWRCKCKNKLYMP